MRISITVDAARDPDAHEWLNGIAEKIRDSWHVWDTTDLNDRERDAMKATSWLRDPSLRELFRDSIRRGGYPLKPHRRRVRVTPDPTSADDMKPEDALRLAEQPLVLLVENSTSDGAFLERILKEFAPDVKKLWRDDGPIHVEDSEGTGSMPQRIRCARQERKRMLVVVDSDRRAPGEPARDPVQKVERQCRESDFACWVLAKREAENYLPRALLAARPNAGLEHAQRVEAWDRLSAEQKDFFDMKEGLSDSLSDAQEALFAGVSPEDRETLESGFGEKVHECWSVWSVQARSELRERGGSDLERGIELIRSQV